MAETETNIVIKRRPVSKARLLKAVLVEMEESKLTDDSTTGELIAAIKESIVTEALAE